MAAVAIVAPSVRAPLATAFHWLTFERDGLDLDRSTLADWVGKATALLEPLAEAIGRHVLSVEAIFADGEPVRAVAIVARTDGATMATPSDNGEPHQHAGSRHRQDPDCEAPDLCPRRTVSH